MKTNHTVERKRRNKKEELTGDEWARLCQLYCAGHSVGTLSSLFDMGHDMISEKLKSLGIYRTRKHLDPSKTMRNEVLKTGKFAGNDFFKK